jgi:hypothetical protein
MSMQSTVNTNASSALNTQKLINSYDGGAQNIHLTAGVDGTTVAITTADGGNTLASVLTTCLATNTNLENVSTFTVVPAAAITTNAGNENGITFNFEFKAAAAASQTDPIYLSFRKAVHPETNVWSAEINYNAPDAVDLTAATAGQTLLDPGSLAFNYQVATLVDGKFAIHLPKCMSTGRAVSVIRSVTFHKRARGVDTSEDV